MADNSNLSRRNRKNKKTKTFRTHGKHTEVTNSIPEKAMSVETTDVLPLPNKSGQTKLKVRASLISKKFELSQNEKLKELLGIGKIVEKSKISGRFVMLISKFMTEKR